MWKQELKQRPWGKHCLLALSLLACSVAFLRQTGHPTCTGMAPPKGLPVSINQQSKKCFIGLPTVQSDGVILSIRIPYTQVTVAYIRLTKRTSTGGYRPPCRDEKMGSGSVCGSGHT